MNKKSRNNVYFKRKRDFKAAIVQFFAVTLPGIADSLTSRINDNFQVLKLASSSLFGIKGLQFQLDENSITMLVVVNMKKTSTHFPKAVFATDICT